MPVSGATDTVRAVTSKGSPAFRAAAWGVAIAIGGGAWYLQNAQESTPEFSAAEAAATNAKVKAKDSSKK